MLYSHLRVFFFQEQETALFVLASVNTLANPHTSAIDFVCAEFSVEKHQINQVLIFPLAARKIPTSVNGPLPWCTLNRCLGIGMREANSTGRNRGRARTHDPEDDEDLHVGDGRPGGAEQPVVVHAVARHVGAVQFPFTVRHLVLLPWNNTQEHIGRCFFLTE